MSSATNNTRTMAICTAVAVATLIPILTSTIADAGRRGRGGDTVVSKDFVVPRGVKGYTGFVPGGSYCDYIRRPNRKCYITRSGREKCRVVSWILTQNCYR